MKISKSKRQLAQLLIEAGVTQFPEGANWVAQGGGKGRVGFCVNKQVRDGVNWTTDSGSLICTIEVAGRIPNWHQTVLSRDEFDQIVAETVPDADGWIEWRGGECPVDGSELVVCMVRSGKEWRNGRAIKAEILRWRHTGGMTDIIAYRLHKPELAKSTAVGDDDTNLAAKEELEALEAAEPQYCESVARSIPEPTTTPTLDQLLQDWRNADDYAQRKQTEADEAAAMRDSKAESLRAYAKECGMVLIDDVLPTLNLCMALADSIPTRLQNHEDQTIAEIGRAVNVDGLYARIRDAIEMMK